MRVDKAKNTWSVWKSILTNPLKTDREIAEELWIWKSSVNRAKKELGQIGAKDKEILDICKTDLSIVKLWQAEIERRLSEKEELEKMRTVEISQVIKENTARYSIFKWDATDKEWGLKNIDQIDIL